MFALVGYTQKLAIVLISLVGLMATATNPLQLRAQEAEDGGIVSNAVGLNAYQRLAANRSLQEELEVSPNQLAKLEDVLKSERVHGARKTTDLDLAILALMHDDALDQQDFGEPAQFESSVDGLVAKEGTKIFHPEQIAGLRINYLRDRLRYPSQAINRPNLSALELRRSQVDEAISHMAGPMQVVEAKAKEVRARAIATLLSLLPEKSSEKFTMCFGSTYAANGDKGGFDKSSIGVFEIDRGFWPLHVLGSINPDLHLTIRQESGRIRKASFVGNANVHKEVLGAMQNLASQTEYHEAFEEIHLSELEQDLRCINRPRLLRYLEIPPELQAVTFTESSRLQQEIDSARLELEVPLLKRVYARSPQEIREKLKWMYDGVWCELD